MNQARAREAVWAAAFVSQMPAGYERWQRRTDGERLLLAKSCAARADLAVELFEMAVAPAPGETPNGEDG